MYKLNRWPPLNCLKGFQAAARLGSFSAAADALHMTQSAVSHQVKTLEDFLGQELFLRANRKVVLSDAGHDFLQTTDAAMDILADGLKRLEQYNKPNQLIVHCSSAFGSNWLLPRLDDLRETHPEVDIWLYTTDQQPDLDMDEVHLAILEGDSNWPGLDSCKLFDDFYLPLCAPDHPVMQLTDPKPGDLLDFTLLHGEQEQSWHTWFAANDLPDINPVNGPNFSNPGLQIQAAVQGQGIALCSMVLAANEIEGGRLVCAVPTAIQSSKGYYLVQKPDGLKSAWLGDFLRWLGEAEIEFRGEQLEGIFRDNRIVAVDV